VLLRALRDRIIKTKKSSQKKAQREKIDIHAQSRKEIYNCKPNIESRIRLTANVLVTTQKGHYGKMKAIIKNDYQQPGKY
jgi:hypothetical protein